MQPRKYLYPFKTKEAQKIWAIAIDACTPLVADSEEQDIILAGAMIWTAAFEDAEARKKSRIFYPQKTLFEIFSICYPKGWSPSFGYLETIKKIGHAALIEEAMDFDGKMPMFDHGAHDIPSRFNKYRLPRSRTSAEMWDFILRSKYLQSYVLLERINFKSDDATQMLLERISKAHSIAEVEENIKLLLIACEAAYKQSSKACCGLGGIFGGYPAQMQRAIKLLENLQIEIDAYRAMHADVSVLRGGSISESSRIATL